MSSVVDNVVDIETDRAGECGFELKITDNLPLTVSGDADLLEQALINLIENALRYSNGKNIILSVDFRFLFWYYKYIYGFLSYFTLRRIQE